MIDRGEVGDEVVDRRLAAADLGRYDRAWGPERKIFGTLRYMSSDATAKKLSVKKYIAKYGG